MPQEFDKSLNDFIDRVRSEFDRQFSRRSYDAVVSPGEYVWATDIYSDYLIARQGDKYFRVSMEVTEEAITFAARDKWEEVRLSYVAEMLPPGPKREIMLVWEFKGSYPEVDFADGVDYDALTEGDDDPIFVTLPIGKANVTSGNKRHYDDKFVAELERQVLAKKPIGLMGHLSPSQRATEFPQEAVHWVGAKRVGELLWAKGYLPPGEARARLKRYKASGKKIATSIDAANLDGVWDDKLGAYRMLANTLDLAQIDIAPADRAGIADLAAVPHFTTEMTPGTAWVSNNQLSQEDDMADKAQVIREMTADDAKILPEPVRQAVLQTAGTAPEVAQVQELRTVLGVDDKADLKAVVTEMRKQQDEQRKRDIKARVVELATPDPKRKPDEDKSIKIDSVRGIVVEMVNAREPKTIDEAERIYGEVAEMQSVKELLAAHVTTTMGPRQGTPLQRQAGEPKYFKIPAEKQEA